MPPDRVKEFRRFCDILVYNYPALLEAGEAPEQLRIHPPSQDTWSLVDREEGFELAVKTPSGTIAQLGIVNTRIEAQEIARHHLADRTVTFAFHPFLDAFVPIWEANPTGRRFTLKQKIYRGITKRAEKEESARQERLTTEDATIGGALAELKWTTIVRLKHATEGQKLLMQRIKGGRISGWDRTHKKHGCPHCAEDRNGGRISHIFWHCPKAKILWSQLEDIWTPSGKGWERAQPRRFCQEVFSLNMSAQPTGLWDWQNPTPSTVDTDEVLQAREKITELWTQHVLITFNVLWRWRNGLQDEEGRWSEELAAAIHIGAIRTETQYLLTGMHRIRAARRLGWTIIKKLKNWSTIEHSPNGGMLTRHILHYSGQAGLKPKTGRAGAAVVRSNEAGTAANIIWSTGMNLTGTTYNQTGYEGLIAGLAEAQKNNWTPLEAVGDNALIRRHLTKHRPPKKKKLLSFCAVARRLADTLGVRHWHQHRREFNRMARAAATHGTTVRPSASAPNPTEQPELASYLSGDHTRWQSSYWSRALGDTC